jgi:hypothetical protein
MKNSSFPRNVFLLLLVVMLAAPWAAAAVGPTDARPVQAAASRLDLLARFWTFLKSAWSETGCHLDPDGRCAPAHQPQTDSGCHIDPNGGCGP